MKSDPLITYRRKPASLDLSQLESFAELLRTRVARGREFHCRITNDEELAPQRPLPQKRLPNRRPLFPRLSRAGQAVPPARHSLGDIAISLDRARAQAKQWRHSTEDELRILLLHGVLHLTGLDHETDSGRMRRAELRWRRKLGLPTGVIERARADSMIFVLIVILSALIVLFTSVQTLYLEGMRLRTRDLPALDYFKSELEPRLNLRSEEGALTFSLWKHTCLVLFGVAVLGEVIDGGTLNVPVFAEALADRVAADDALRLSDSSAPLPPHLGPLDLGAPAFLYALRARHSPSGDFAKLSAFPAGNHR